MKSEKENNFFHVMSTGVVSGFAASYASFIFVAIKKRVQSEQISPTIVQLGLRLWTQELFRGSINYSCLMAPTALVQQTADEWCKYQLPVGRVGQVSGAVCSGALGGVVATVAENILLRQQMTSVSALQAVKILCHESNTSLFRGLWLYMMREAIFGFFYLHGIKEVGEYTKNTVGPTYVRPAQIALGILCSVFSQPLDTMATTMQRHNFKQMRQAFDYLAAQSPAAFYRGGLARAAVFTTAAFVISYTQETMKNIEMKLR